MGQKWSLAPSAEPPASLFDFFRTSYAAFSLISLSVEADVDNLALTFDLYMRLYTASFRISILNDAVYNLFKRLVWFNSLPKYFDLCRTAAEKQQILTLKAGELEIYSRCL